jgi:hypothetical protein
MDARRDGCVQPFQPDTDPPGAPAVRIERVDVTPSAVHVDLRNRIDSGCSKQQHATILADERLAALTDDPRDAVDTVAEHDHIGTFEDHVPSVAADARAAGVAHVPLGIRAFKGDIASGTIEHVHVAPAVRVGGYEGRVRRERDEAAVRANRCCRMIQVRAVCIALFDCEQCPDGQPNGRGLH